MTLREADDEARAELEMLLDDLTGHARCERMRPTGVSMQRWL